MTIILGISEYQQSVINIDELDISDKIDLVRKYDGHVTMLNENYTDYELRNILNYTDSQIDAIRRFDYSMEKRIAASAISEMQLFHYNYYYDSSTNTTSISVGVNVLIYGLHFIDTQKTLGVAAVGSNANFLTGTGGDYSFVARYRNSSGKPDKYIYRGSSGVLETHDVGTGVRFAIKNSIYEYSPPQTHSWTISEMQIRYHAKASGRVNLTGIRSTLTYRTVNVAINFGFSYSNQGNASIGLTISPKWVQELDQYKREGL